MLDALRQIPCVSSVAASTMVPFAGNGVATRVSADAAGANASNAQLGLISPEFFDTLGVSMRQGRAFTARDTPQTRTAIVNETLASRLIGGNPIGAMVWSEATAYEIVGVVTDHANTSVNERTGRPRLYLPAPMAASSDLGRVIFLIRAAGDPAPLVEAVRRTIPKAITGDAVVNAIGMLLTAAGVYGVLAFAITHRSKEFAVRIAVGASAADLVQLVAAQSSKLVAIGIAATWLPTRRARRIDPAQLLRTS